MNEPTEISASTHPSAGEPAEGRTADLLRLFALGVLWGSSFLFIKVTIEDVPAITLVAGRLGLSTLLMLPLLAMRGQRLPRSPRTWVALAVLGLFNAALPYTFISWGEQFISSGLASLLMATTPIFTVLLAWLFRIDEALTPVKVAGVVVGFAGVGLLIVPELREGLQASVIGQLAIVLSCLSYAGAALFARRFLSDLPAIVMATGQLLTGFLFILPASLIVDRPFDLAPSLPALASWAGLSVLGTVLAYFLYFTLLKRTGATFTTMVTYIVPINGLLLGALVLHEPFSGIVLASLTLVITGAFLVRR